MDENNSRRIDFLNFKKSLKEFRIPLSDAEIQDIFYAFDVEKSGIIDYLNFIRRVRGEYSYERR